MSWTYVFWLTGAHMVFGGIANQVTSQLERGAAGRVIDIGRPSLVHVCMVRKGYAQTPSRPVS